MTHRHYTLNCIVMLKTEYTPKPKGIDFSNSTTFSKSVLLRKTWVVSPEFHVLSLFLPEKKKSDLTCNVRISAFYLSAYPV